MHYIKVILLAANVFTCIAATAETVCDFRRNGQEVRLNDAKARQQSIKIETYNSVFGNIAILSATPAIHGYLELQLTSPYIIAENEKQLNGRLAIELCSPTPEAIRKISIRLTDAKGETFQLMQTVQLRRGEWTTIKFQLEPSTRFNPIWGGNNDRKIDYPVRFSALTVDFDRQRPGEANMMLDNLVWLKP